MIVHDFMGIMTLLTRYDSYYNIFDGDLCVCVVCDCVFFFPAVYSEKFSFLFFSDLFVNLFLVFE
jgi:hypothetical protein